MSDDNKINEDTLFNIINSQTLIPNTIDNRNSVVNEAILFFKHNFLQKIGEEYIFQSHQLFQVALGLHIFNLVSSSEQFDFKNEKIERWREVSYAGTIARVKGEGIQITDFLSDFLSDLLSESERTPAAAVILLEAQITNLNKVFLDKVKALSLRPLKYWGKNDSLAPHAYAYILKDLGPDGFDWFFESYLNPKHPQFIIGDELVEFILQYYFILNNFKVTYEKEKLISTIDYHLASRTFSCIDFLPLLALVVPEEFNEQHRCKLLASVSKVDVLFSRAEELLQIEWDKGLNHEILDSLEIICGEQRSEGNINTNALKLWFKFSDKAIPKSILDNCIISIAKKNNDIYDLITSRIDKGYLESYLRFKVLYKNPICDSASILLYRYYGERDIYLIGEPLLIRSEWFDYNNQERRQIIEDIFFSREGDYLTFIINKYPSPEKDYGLSDNYILYFLKALEVLEETYINEFLDVVNNFNKYVLIKYPEIRDYLIKLLSRREYYEPLKKCLHNLDQNLRYNAATILLACFPESEKEALEIIVRSCCVRPLDNAEYYRFCMKLNYSIETLDFLSNLLEDLTEISRIFALKILYHNKGYKLNDQLLSELIYGLLGKGRSFDYSLNLNDDGVESVQKQSTFFKNIIDLLDDESYEIKRSASATLLSYFSSLIDIEDRAKCWLYYSQYSPRSLFDFLDHHMGLFENQKFVSALKDNADKLLKNHKKRSVLLKYYEANYEDGSWKDFFIAFLESGIHMDHHDLERLYIYFVQIKDNSIRSKIGLAVKELMAAPTFSQEKEYGFIYAVLALYAYEFGALNEEEVISTLSTYNIFQEEIFCSLLYRLGYIPENSRLNKKSKDYILFKENENKDFIALDKLKIEDQLIEGIDIPHNLTDIIESVLINNYYTDNEFTDLSQVGSVAASFLLVISFCEKREVSELNKMFNSEDIGNIIYYPKGHVSIYKSILLKIKDILLLEKENKDASINRLINNINSVKDRDNVSLFNELFALNADFDIQLLPKLIDSLFANPFMIDLDLTYKLFDFILEAEQKSDLKILTEPFKRQLKAILSVGEDLHTESYELITWCLTLTLLYIEKVPDEYTKRGFLIGLNNIFVQDGYNYASEISKSGIKFKGRDFLIHSHRIFNQIEDHIIKDIIQEGIESDMPQISSLCKILSALSK